MNRLDSLLFMDQLPIAPELEPPKSSASLLLGLGQTAIGGWKEATEG